MGKNIKNKRNIILFELRSVKDDDIDEALKKVIRKGYTKSDAVRDALRHFLLKRENFPTVATRGLTIESSSIYFALKEIEKDDTQLDDALDDLLNF